MEAVKNFFNPTPPNKFETVLRDAIDAENEALKPKKLEKLIKNENLYKEINNVHLFMRDCLGETPEPVHGILKGEIPEWLNGVFIRNGPGKRTFGTEKTQHAFDSAALLRKFAIKDGKVTFQTKFLKSNMYQRNSEAQRIVMGEFGTASTSDPCKTIFQKFSSIFQKKETTDNCLVSVYPFNDELYALTETVKMHRINPQNLDTLKEVNLKDRVAVVHHTAHPHVDEDGTVYGLGMTGGSEGPKYAVVEFPNSKRGSQADDVFAEGKIVAKIPIRWRLSPCYMHSYGVSPNYFVIIEQPVGISLVNMMVGKVLNHSFADSLKWYEEPTLIHVVSRKTGSLVRTFEAETFFFFHTINQFEEDGQIVIDVCCYRDFSGVNTLMEKNLQPDIFQKNIKFADTFRGRPLRFVCPLDPPEKSGNLVTLKHSTARAEWCGDKIQVTAEILLDKSCDMPKVYYEKYNGKKYKYFYCFSGDLDDDDSPYTLKKVNVETKTSTTWGENGAFPSEPYFVPRPESQISHCCRRNSEDKYERVIAREIDYVNYVKGFEAEKRFHNGEDVLPNCDLTVWLRDCNRDIDQPIEGDVMGFFPSWLRGNLLRNGPGVLTIGKDRYNHLFDSPAVIHRFCIENGRVTYQCKFLKTETFRKNVEAQRIVVDEFGTKATTDPCKTIFQQFSAIFSDEMSDNCMISLYPFGDQMYAMGEAPVMYRVDPSNINTLGSVNLKNYVNVVHNSSHPHVEEDGTVYMLGLSVDATGPKYAVMKFPETKKGSENLDVFSDSQVVAKVRTRWPFHPGYMHSFGITPNYFVIIEQPLSVSLPAKVTCKLANKPMSNMLRWYPEYPTVIYVVSRHDGSVVRKYEAEPFFYLHVINQYEEEGHVVVDVCAYRDPSMIDCMLIESLKGAHENPKYANLFRSRAVRFVLPLRPSKSSGNVVTLGGTEAKAYYVSKDVTRVVPELLCNIGCETPRVNYPLYLGKKYRYFYSISAEVDSENPGTLIKVDTYTKTYRTWNEPSTFPCEPIFVASPNAQSEDDGVILTSLLWGSDDRKVACVILDAKSFTEIARAEFVSPTPVPKCLHGWFTSM